MKAILLVLSLLAIVLSASAYDAVCNGRGAFQNNKCQCHPEYIGARCQTRICNRGSPLEVACNIHGGVCDTISYPARCLCKPGFFGNDCSSKKSVQALPSTLEGSYTGSATMYPIDFTNGGCQSGCNGYTVTLSSFTVTGTSMTAQATQLTGSGNCTAFSGSLSVTVANADIKNGTSDQLTGTVTFTVTPTGGNATNIVNAVASTIRYGAGSQLQITYNLAESNNPPALTVDPLNTACNSTMRIAKFTVTKSVTPTPSSASALSASLFMILSVIVSFLAFL